MEVIKNTELQLNISNIMPARLKKDRDMGCEYHFRTILS